MPGKTPNYTFRLDPRLLAQIDRLIVELGKPGAENLRKRLNLYGNISKAKVVQIALSFGLDSLEELFPVEIRAEWASDKDNGGNP